MRGRWLILVAALALSGCTCNGDALFHRMIDQQKVEPYEGSLVFSDGRGMRHPPPGTVPRERLGSDRGVRSGRNDNGSYRTALPVPLTRALLEDGRRTFDVTCATCHGLVGDGNSLVAANMGLAAPPSLHPRAKGPPGFIFEVITEGRGLMPAYAAEISPERRWAVAAYLRALERSQNAPLAAAPSDVQARLTAEEAGR